MSQVVNDSGLKRIYSRLSAETAEDIVFRNQALYDLGMLYFEKCDFRNAIDCFEKVKTEALQFHLYDNFFMAVSRLLRIHAERLDFDSQKRLQSEALQVGNSLASFRRFQPRLQYNQGIASIYNKEHALAEATLNDGILAARTLLADQAIVGAERREVLRTLFSARYAIATIKRIEGAAQFTLELLKKLREDISEATAQDPEMDLFELKISIGISEGTALRDSGQLQQALDRYWEVHRQLKVRKSWHSYYYVLLSLGRTYQLMGDAIKASTFYDLVQDAVHGLELNSLKQTLQSFMSGSGTGAPQIKLVLDRERKRVMEEKIGEVHFERRFVLLEILYLLAAQPGRVFGKEELVSEIWGENYNPMIHDSKVYTSISRLRKLIEPDFRHPRYILNERDGYAFNPNVQVVEMGKTVVAAESVVAAKVMERRKTLPGGGEHVLR